MSATIKRDDLNNFISFGCWNQKSGGVKKVLDTLKRIETDAVFISGDNYYPVKKEKYDPVKGKMKKDKTIILEDLKEGFMELVASTIDKPVYMNFGNHDMVKNDGYKVVPAKDGSPIVECAIMKEELKFNGRNTHIAMNHKIVSEHTLVLMIDTTIYCSSEEFDEDFANCYAELKSMPEDGLQAALQERQRAYVIGAINSFQGENVILIGHNPIIYEKRKKGGALFQMDSGVEFSDMLFDIIQTPHYDDLNIYYLCADYHQYEEGVVTIEKGGQSIQIHQYIAGMGGTKLDEYNPKQVHFEKTQGPYIFRYDHVKTKTQHGLLQANYEDGWEFTFIPVRKGVARYFRRKTANARRASTSRLKLGNGRSRRSGSRGNLTLRNGNQLTVRSRSSRR